MDWNDVLRRACEVAGLHIRSEHEAWGYSAVTPVQGGERWVYTPDNPALPAYVAELLVAQVVQDMHAYSMLERPLQLITGHTTEALAWKYSTSRQRILAALVALNKMTLEQAREVSGAAM